MIGLSLIQRIVGGAALVLILGLSIALFFADRRADKWEKQAIKANAELQRISSDRNEQRETSGRNVEQAERGNEEADRQAERIENAPTAPDCETPPEIMGAGL